MKEPGSSSMEYEEHSSSPLHMPFKSKAQRRKFAQMLVDGEITPEVYEEWNRETGGAHLPERVGKKRKSARPRRKRRSTRAKASTTKRAATRKKRVRAATRRGNVRKKRSVTKRRPSRR